MRQQGAVTLGKLCDHSAALPALADLYRAVWPGWYGPQGPSDAGADLAERNRADGLPLGLVALSAGQVIGAAALAAQSFGAMAGEGPWLVGLAVAPAFRRQGIADRLIALAEATARPGAPWLYCTTTTTGLLLRRGWGDLRRAGEGPDRVFRLTLT